MKEEQKHLINKIFNNETIRTIWDKVARDKLEEQLGESIVTKDNRLNYEYNDKKQLEMNK